MGVNEEKNPPKELHICSNFGELRKRADLAKPEKKMDFHSKYPYLKMMAKLHMKIEEAQLSIDHEQEYIFLYRYMQVLTVMEKHTEPPIKQNKKEINEMLKSHLVFSVKHIDRLEKLEMILKDRYQELNSRTVIEVSLPPTQLLPVEREKEKMDLVEENKALLNEKSIGFMGSAKLYLLIKTEKNISLLIIDCRTSDDFKSSHMLYDDMINIPKNKIILGNSAALLGYAIEKQYHSLWDKRHAYDIVLLVDKDFCSNSPLDPVRTITILKDILVNWDCKGSYKALVILDGGFEDFQSMYPHMTTNPKYSSFKSNSTSKNDIFNSFDYPEVPEIVPPKPPEVKKAVPTVNRLIKPKTDYTALKEFDERERSKVTVDALPFDRGDPASHSVDPHDSDGVPKQSDETFPAPLDRTSLPESATSLLDEQTPSNKQPANQKPPNDESTDNISDAFSSPQIVSTSVHLESDDRIKSILKSKESKMSEDEKAAFVNNLRKVKPKASENRPGPSSEMDLSDEEERVPLKKDGMGSNMKRSLSSPNIAEAKYDDISTPMFSRTNKPSFPLRSQPTPYVLGESMDAVYGKTPVGLTGLKNFANNCYMNSILQCLSNTEPLVRELINLNKPLLNTTSSTKGQVATEVITALRYIWSGEIKVYSIRELKNLMGNFKDIFKGSNHQDSHEFLIILLEYLHDDLNIPRDIMNITGASETSGEKAWGEFKKKNQSIIQHLFYGQEQSTVTCKTCLHESITFDHFFNLSVPIPDSDRTTLEECMQIYLSGEDIVWRCPKCKVDRNAVKKLDITRLPPILIIALKRFSQEGQYSWLEKKENLVTYPLENLEMRSFTLPGSEQRHTKYNLHALSTHTGTLRSGHYRAICKNRLTSKWYLFDDSSIQLISPQDVRNNPEVYILFYHAVN